MVIMIFDKRQSRNGDNPNSTPIPIDIQVFFNGDIA